MTSKRLTILWAVMMALTLISVSTSERWFSSGAVAAFVIAIAFVKVRVVVLDFMEVRQAPMMLRLLLEIWVVGLAGTLIVLFV